MVTAAPQIAVSDGSLPVIWPTTSAADIGPQSSRCWWRHHWAASVGLPYVVTFGTVSGAAWAAPANPTTAAAAAAASRPACPALRAAAKNLMSTMGFPSLEPLGLLCVEKRFRDGAGRIVQGNLERSSRTYLGDARVTH